MKPGTIAEAVLIAVRAGEVVEHRTYGGPTSPDFYVYKTTIYGRPLKAAEQPVLRAFALGLIVYPPVLPYGQRSAPWGVYQPVERDLDPTCGTLDT